MNKTYIGYRAPTLSLGRYLSDTRHECIANIQPGSVYELRSNFSQCILEQFTEYEKDVYASRGYILTLWPAFVGAIVAMGSDASRLIYDNVWWSCLFAVTSGGLPGLDVSSVPPHHLEAPSYNEAHAKCTGPHRCSKTRTMGSKGQSAGTVRLEWVTLLLSCGLWM